MNLLSLYTGLLLPWICGVLWLVYADTRFSNNTVNRWRQLGYGYFLGYAILSLVILASDRWLGGVSWPGIMMFLLLLSVAGVATVYRGAGRFSPDWPVLKRPSNPLTSFLLLLVVCLLIIHVLFISVEIFTRPVYPWDAWLAWVYRAKTWFMAGSMVDIVGPETWITASTSDTYTINAWRYPLFASTIPYWAALSLGHWSETLVNLPVLFAGLALGMALYGQCRERGLGVAASLLVCYLLFSIPIIGTHLALAGYADTWMAGFTGLGFIAVMRGVMERKRPGAPAYQTLLGLSMIAFGICIKNEGAVWFLAALAILLFTNFRPRVPVLIAVATVVLVSLGFVLGHNHVELPIAGGLGFQDDHLSIPFIGSFELEIHDIGPVYWENFLRLGSWNLLWLAVAASLLLTFRRSSSSHALLAKRVALTFVLVFSATQVFIFGFTEQGLWADTYTAVNRLPIHFAPALLFAVVIIAQASIPVGSQPHFSTAKLYVPLVTVLLAAIIVVAGLVIYLSRGLIENDGQDQVYPGDTLSFAFGSGFPTGGRVLVDGFANGYALLSSGPVSISADSVRAIESTWLPPRPNLEAAFFWRRSDDSQNVLRTEITTPGRRLTDLAAESEWHGQITEFGFLIAGSTGDTVEIGTTELLADSVGTRLKLAWQGWASFEGWTLKSINFLYGGDSRQLVSLPLLVIAWFITALLLLALLYKLKRDSNRQQFFVVACTLFLLGWLLLDVRWSINNVRQAKLSLHKYSQASTSPSPRFELDADIYQYVQRLKSEVFETRPARVLILGDENAADYYLLRAKYHLLPHSVKVAGDFAPNLQPDSLDYVIFFGQPEGISRTNGWTPLWRMSLQQIDRSDHGVVYRSK